MDLRVLACPNDPRPGGKAIEEIHRLYRDIHADEWYCLVCDDYVEPARIQDDEVLF